MAKNPKNLFGIMDLFKSKPKIDPVTNKPPAKQGVQFGPTKKEATDTLLSLIHI
mgnify:CR=1 FL=1